MLVYFKMCDSNKHSHPPERRHLAAACRHLLVLLRHGRRQSRQRQCCHGGRQDRYRLRQQPGAVGCAVQVGFVEKYDHFLSKITSTIFWIQFIILNISPCKKLSYTYIRTRGSGSTRLMFTIRTQLLIQQLIFDCNYTFLIDYYNVNSAFDQPWGIWCVIQVFNNQ